MLDLIRLLLRFIAIYLPAATNLCFAENNLTSIAPIWKPLMGRQVASETCVPFVLIESTHSKTIAMRNYAVSGGTPTRCSGR